MTPQDALTQAMHHVRTQLSQIQLAKVTGIKEDRLRKIRCGELPMYAEEAKLIVDAIYAVSPRWALFFAQSLVPADLVTASPAEGKPDVLELEVFQSCAAAGDIARAYAEAVKDGKLSEFELQELEQLASDNLQQGSELLAALKNTRSEQA